MVRLKVIITEQIENPVFVSIPYGTIKRRISANLLQMPNFVSIPYGTIKSKYSKLYIQESKKFQFLMVRLKEHEVATALVLDKFQFLMVRLKALMQQQRSNLQTMFQFLMVRLKVLLLLIPRMNLPCFNSLWYD